MSSGSVAFPSIVQLIMSLHNVSSIPRLPMSFEHLISRLQTRDTRKTQDNPHSSQSSINKLLLQLGNLSLELLNLLPTIQRPTISSDEGVRRSVYWARRAASSLRMRSSSAVTRCWIWSSRLRWRVESVFCWSEFVGSLGFKYCVSIPRGCSVASRRRKVRS
jgi:hypothetical protein